MIRIASLLLVTGLAAGCTSEDITPTDDLSSTDQAASVHFKGGRDSGPVFRDLGSALRASGALSGLGNADIRVTIEATGTSITSCQNPGTGEHFPAGIHPGDTTLSGDTIIPADEIKNGNVAFTVETEEAPDTVAGAPGCPNRQWIQHVLDVRFLDALVNVEQPIGTDVFSVYCTFSPSTSNGLVPSGNVSCQ